MVKRGAFGGRAAFLAVSVAQEESKGTLWAEGSQRTSLRSSSCWTGCTESLRVSLVNGSAASRRRGAVLAAGSARPELSALAPAAARFLPNGSEVPAVGSHGSGPAWICRCHRNGMAGLPEQPSSRLPGAAWARAGAEAEAEAGCKGDAGAAGVRFLSEPWTSGRWEGREDRLWTPPTCRGAHTFRGFSEEGAGAPLHGGWGSRDPIPLCSHPERPSSEIRVWFQLFISGAE